MYNLRISGIQIYIYITARSLDWKGAGTSMGADFSSTSSSTGAYSWVGNIEYHDLMVFN
jgi:hypothetical protein